MKNPLKGSSARKGGLHTQSRNVHVTKSGQKIKLNQNLVGRMKARRDARQRKKAAYLATLPKGRIKRTLYRLHPKRVAKYWFSREGGIMALKIAGIAALATFLMLIGIFAYFRKDLPNLRDISGNNIGGSIRYYDRSGQTLLWEDYDAVKRSPVKDEDISQLLKDATVAVEDKDFFNHGGFDTRGIVRAGVNNALGKGGTQGGSTITQQLVKLTQNWSKDQTYTRKVKELILSVELERSYSKKEILAGYVNTAPYSDIAYGAEAAMQDYFNKPAKDMTLDEAAFLAAIPKSPTYYSPYGARFEKDALLGRQHYVLDLMAQQGKITDKQRDEAKKVDTIAKIKPRHPKYESIKAPWFVLTAKEQLQEKFGQDTVKRGGWKVTTTLDLDKQKLAEDQVAKGMRQIQRQGGDVAAFAAEDVKTGQMVALVGGPDFNNKDFGENNYARTKLPPGSSFKPYDYTSLIENTTNFGAGSVLYDTVGPLDGYPCTNKALPERGGNCLYDYDRKSPGPVTLRYALGGSRNIPAVKAMLTAGIDKTIDTSKKLMRSPGSPEGEARGDYKCYKEGVYDVQNAKKADEQSCFTSSAIGDGAYLKLDEHVHGYATLSRNGLNIPQTYILKIEDSGNKVVDEWKPSKGVQAVRADAAYIVDDMISDPNASYFSQKSHRYKGWKFGFKTGTTNDNKDGWMMTMSTQYAAGMWVGYHNREKALTGAMETMTQPVITGWMNKTHDPIKPEERQKPSGVQSLPAFVVRSHVGFGSIEPSPANDLFPSWYKKSTPGSKQTIDIVSNKLATDCTPARAKKDGANAAANQFSGDRFVGGGGANTNDKDDVHKCEDAKPNVTLTVSDNGNGNYTLTATATAGTHPLSSDRFHGTINLYVDDQQVQSFPVDSSPATVSYNYAATAGGQHTVKAEVIDSVLYDNNDTKSVAFTGPVNAGTISLSAQQTGANTIFSWSGNSGTTSIYRSTDTNGTSPLCSSGSGSCNTSAINAPIGTEIYAKDSNGTRSSNVTVGS